MIGCVRPVRGKRRKCTGGVSDSGDRNNPSISPASGSVWAPLGSMNPRCRGLLSSPQVLTTEHGHMASLRMASIFKPMSMLRSCCSIIVHLTREERDRWVQNYLVGIGAANEDGSALSLRSSAVRSVARPLTSSRSSTSWGSSQSPSQASRTVWAIGLVGLSPSGDQNRDARWTRLRRKSAPRENSSQ